MLISNYRYIITVIEKFSSVKEYTECTRPGHTIVASITDIINFFYLRKTFPKSNLVAGLWIRIRIKPLSFSLHDPDPEGKHLVTNLFLKFVTFEQSFFQLQQTLLKVNFANFLKAASALRKQLIRIEKNSWIRIRSRSPV